MLFAINNVRRGNRLIKWAITLALGIALRLAGSGTVARADCKLPSEMEEIRDPAVISALSGAFGRLQTEEVITTQASGDTLQYDKIKVGRVRPSDGVEYLTVTVPMGGQYELPSNVTAVFSTDLDLLTYSETQVWNESERVYRVKTLNDGAVTVDKSVDVSQVTEEQAREAMARAFSGGGGNPESLKGVVGCIIAVLGVDSILGFVMAIACSGSCATPVTMPACSVCIGGYFATGAAVVGGVAACFQLLHD